MRTVKLYEKNEEVFIKGIIDEVSMDNGEIVYSIKSVDTGKNMGVWFKDTQLIAPPHPKIAVPQAPKTVDPNLGKNTEPIIEG